MLPVATNGGVQAINLGMYENVRRRLAPEPSPLWSHFVAGTVGGLCIAPLTTPLSRIKVQQQLSGASFVATARSIGSVQSLYAGVGATTLFEGSRGFYMIAYSLLKRALTSETHGVEASGTPPSPPLWVRTVAGAGANVLTWGVMYPVDTIRNVQQAAGAAGGACDSMWTSARKLVAQGGWQRLYRGYALTLVRAGPVAGITLPCFEVVLPWLEGREPRG